MLQIPAGRQRWSWPTGFPALAPPTGSSPSSVVVCWNTIHTSSWSEAAVATRPCTVPSLQRVRQEPQPFAQQGVDLGGGRSSAGRM